MKALQWHFVYTRDSKPLAAFCDYALAEAYCIKSPEQGETIVARSLIIAGESKAIRLLRDIVANDYSQVGDERMMAAIDEARKLLKIADHARAPEGKT
jgi:hypothetical protein